MSDSPGVRAAKELAALPEKHCKACSKKLVKRSDEILFMFKKREHCDKKCAGIARKLPERAPEPKLVFFGPRRKRGGYHARSTLCVACGNLPHRVPGGVGAVCKCGTVGADGPRLVYAGSLLKSSAGRLVDVAPERDD